MIDLHNAIRALHSNVVLIRGNEAFDVDGKLVQYDMEQVQAYIDAQAYKVKRAAEYPSITDQLDLLFHGGINAWKASIQAVKTKYPKA